jgi:hypothetical protein
MAASRKSSRRDPSVEDLLGSLRDLKPKPRPLSVVRKWLISDRLDLVEELLDGMLATRRPTFQMRDTFQEALHLLASTRGPDPIAAVLRVADHTRATVDDLSADRRPTSPGPWLRDCDRDVAGWLCDGQRLDDLTPLFAAATPDDELAACLLQEAVRRHGDLGSIDEAVGFAHRLRDAGHPLGRLPLRLLEAERWYAPDRRVEVQYPAGWYAATYEPRPQPSDAADGPPDLELAATEVEWPAARQARHAFRDYQIESDGESEARRYLLDRPLDPERFGASVLVALSPDCLRGAQGRTPQVLARRADVADVWALLYEQSLWGGPYVRGRGAAYSRMAAWEALAAICGATGDLAEVEGTAARCTWSVFDTDSPWFMQVHESLDVGLAALWPDHRTVVLVAATDSD